MANTQTMDDPAKSGHEGGSSGSRGAPPRVATGGTGGMFSTYKAEQGKWTRLGTILACGALSAWGGVFFYEHLSGFAGPGFGALLVTKGIPIVIAVALFAVCWWAVYVNRKSGDFMIATEGEMKKVSWSNRREVIGSTKVVIIFTILMALLLFLFDLGFQRVFYWLGVLKTK